MTFLARRLALFVTAAAIALAGCGESEEDEFKGDYRPINDELVSIGGDLGMAIETARGKTNAQIARQFGDIARDVAVQNEKLKELEPPDELEDELARMTSGFDDVVAALERIETASKANDADAVRTATVDLVTRSQKVSKAQNRLAAETGAEQGEN